MHKPDKSLHFYGATSLSWKMLIRYEQRKMVSAVRWNKRAWVCDSHSFPDLPCGIKIEEKRVL